MSQFISDAIGAEQISEAAIKRAMRPGFATHDCLDESLRDAGYRRAIAACRESLLRDRSVVLDASFHRRVRREWLLQALAPSACAIVGVYLRCDNAAETVRRIRARTATTRDARTQADSIEVFRHIDAGFEEPRIEEFTAGIRGCLFELDTFGNNVGEIVTCPTVSRESEWFVALEDALVRYVGKWRQALLASQE